MSRQAWMVFAGKQTRGFKKKGDAERWAQAVEAFSPRSRPAVQKVVRR